MATNKTQQELASLNDQTIRNRSEQNKIDNLQHADLNGEIIHNLFSGNASSMRKLEINISATYKAIDHKNALVVINPSAPGVAWTLPEGLFNTDNITIFNISSSHSVNLKPLGGAEIRNLIGNALTDTILPGGRVHISKNATNIHFSCFGTGLSYQGAFMFITGFPRAINPTVSGGLFQVMLNRNGTAWYGVYADATPNPGAPAIKAGTGAIVSGSSLSCTANIVTAHAFSSGSIAAGTTYTIWVVAESGADQIITSAQFTAAAAPSVGDIAFGNFNWKKNGQAGYNYSLVSGIGTTTFDITLSMLSSSVCFVYRTFRAAAGRPTNLCTIGGNTLTKITSIEVPKSGSPSYYIDVFQFIKEDAPANGTRQVLLQGPAIQEASELVGVFVLNEAEQLIIPAGQIKTASVTAVTSHQHTFSGLPGTGYMLVNIGITRDEGDTIFLNVPGDQTILNQGEDQENISTVSSYKDATAVTNDMDVTGGHSERIGHIALQINPIVI